jgi:antitoxin (DNA-binding transcriptional repressor) of toxin-antitoxin stability system
MRTIQLSQASRPLAEYADELDGEIVVLMKRNRPVAAIVPLRNVDRESLSLSTNPKFLKLIQRSRADFAAGRKRSLEEVRELFGLRVPANKVASPARGRGTARPKRASPRRRHSE